MSSSFGEHLYRMCRPTYGLTAEPDGSLLEEATATVRVRPTRSGCMTRTERWSAIGGALSWCPTTSSFDIRRSSNLIRPGLREPRFGLRPAERHSRWCCLGVNNVYLRQGDVRRSEAATRTMMERRELLRALATVGVAGVVPTLLPRNASGQTPVRYEAYGRGPVLFLGSPFGASKNDQTNDPMATVRQGYLDRLTERYRVILMDYPPTGDAAQAAVASFNPDRVCADILAVADAAGVRPSRRYGPTRGVASSAFSWRQGQTA